VESGTESKTGRLDICLSRFSSERIDWVSWTMFLVFLVLVHGKNPAGMFQLDLLRQQETLRRTERRFRLFPALAAFTSAVVRKPRCPRSGGMGRFGLLSDPLQRTGAPGESN